MTKTLLTADVIMPVDSSNASLRIMTQQAIDSLIKSEPNVKLNILIIDSNIKSQGFNHAKTIVYDFPFNYHKCVNLGLNYGYSDVVAICNNDLLFDRLWLTKIVEAMGEKYLSASPNNKPSSVEGVVEGYRVAKEVLGWCIVVKREIFKKIGKLDECVNFWYSDNIYAEQLKKAGLKHILVLYSHVVHLGSKTLKLAKDKFTITKAQRREFDKRKIIYNDSK